MLAKNPMERRQRSFSLRCGRKTHAENDSRENPRSQVGYENPINTVPPSGFEPGFKRWKAKKDTTTPI